MKPSTEGAVAGAALGSTGATGATREASAYVNTWEDVSLMNQAGSITWPICTFSYLYIKKDMSSWSGEEAKTAALVKAFAQFVLSEEAQAMLPEFGFVGLPPAILTKARSAVSSISVPANTEWTFEKDTNDKLDMLTGATDETAAGVIVGQNPLTFSSKRSAYADYERTKLVAAVAALEAKIATLKDEHVSLHPSAWYDDPTKQIEAPPPPALSASSSALSARARRRRDVPRQRPSPRTRAVDTRSEIRSEVRMTIQRPLDLPTGGGDLARRSRTKKRSARIPNRNAPAAGRQPTCARGRHPRARAPRSLARPRTGRDDDRRSSHLARRRPCIVQKVSHLVSYLVTFVPSFRYAHDETIPDSMNDAKPRRSRIKKILERASVVSVASSFQPRARRVFDTCSNSRRTFARRQSARAPGGVARHAAAASSDIALAWGDTRVAPGPRRGSGRGARRGEGTCPCRKVSISIGPTIARVPVSRPRERDGWPARRAARVVAAARGDRARHPGRARGRGCDARVERRGDGARGGCLRRHR